MEPTHELNVSATRPRLRSWRRRITSLFAFVGAAGLVLAIASLAVVHYRTLHFDRESREIRIKTHDWVKNPRYERAAIVEDTVDTSLLRLRRQSIEIRHFEPSVIQDSQVYWPGAGSAMTSRDSRVLIANRHGSFFEIDLSAAAKKIRRIPLSLDTNYQTLGELLNAELKEQASLQGSHGLRYVGVTDLLFLTDRPAVAAAYTYWNAQQKCITSRVALVDVAQGWPAGTSGWRVVFESAPCLTLTRHQARGNQAGGRLAEVGPGKLYFAVGDFGHDGVVNKDVVSQDSAVSYGKILEIHVDTLDHRIVATGIRNPEGLMRDGQGRIWSTEHGPKGGDELNLIRIGRNYGWPYATYGTNYGSHGWPLSKRQGRHDGYEEPAFAWTPAIGVSNLIAVRNFSPEWNGDLLVLSLVGRRLSRIRLSGERVVLEEPISMGERLRDVAQLADGRIVLWTDTANLVVLSVDTNKSRLDEVLAEAVPDVRSAIARCAECHSFAEGDSADNRINLWGIYGRPFAAGKPELYSDALRRASGTWNRSALGAFLRNPQQVIPGTTMQYAGIGDEGIRAGVVHVLEQLRDSGEPGSPPAP